MTLARHRTDKKISLASIFLAWDGIAGTLSDRTFDCPLSLPIRDCSFSKVLSPPAGTSNSLDLQRLGGGFLPTRDFPIALGNTLLLAFARVVITSVLAIFFAWVVTRTDTPFKGFIEIMLWCGFFLPLLPMTMGWILLLDPHYGLINKFLTNVVGLSAAPFDIYSYWGIIWCHLAFSTSVRFMLMTPAFSAMDAGLGEAGLVCGSNRAPGVCIARDDPSFGTGSTWLQPPWVSSEASNHSKSKWCLVFPPVFTSYRPRSGTLFTGNRRCTTARPRCAVYSCCLFFCWFGYTGFFSAAGNSPRLVAVATWGETLPLGRWRWLTCGLCLVFVTVMILLPLATLIMGTFMELFGHFDLEKTWTARHWTGAFADPVFLRSLKNTIMLGLGAGIGGALVLCP